MTNAPDTHKKKTDDWYPSTPCYLCVPGTMDTGIGCLWAASNDRIDSFIFLLPLVNARLERIE